MEAAGKICNVCKGSDFYPSGGCRPCMRTYAKKWNADNIDRVKECAAKWREKNKVAIAERQKKWKLANPNYDKEWAKNNPEATKLHAKKYADANRDKKNASISRWRYANADRVKTVKSAWNKRNKGALSVFKQNRRAREKLLGGILSKDLAEKLMVLQQGKCAACYLPLEGDYHLDHIIPLALNGINEDSNMQLLHSTCNHKKHSKHPVEFMQKMGFLI